MNVASRVPTEMLCEIFLLLCDEPIALHELNNKLLFHEFPWAVGQVCRDWRWAFLSYPALWSTFSFEAPHPQLFIPSDNYTAEMNRRMAIYLKRSKHQPLSIVVRIWNRFSKSVDATIWGMLLSCSDRWKKATLDIESESIINGLFGRRTKMSILESLTIVIYHLQDHKYGTAFEIAPHLTKLNLGCGETRDGAIGTLETRSFPWAQLTKLTIDPACVDFTNSDTLRTFLLQIQNVEELHLTVLFANPYSDYDVFPCPPVRFSRLKLFEVSITILSFFEAPLLEHLLVCDGDERDAYGEEISSFVQRSSCHIRRLTLRRCTANAAHDITKVLAHVEELYIEQFADERTTDFVGTICLPDLRLLEVSCCPGNFDDVVLVASRLFSTRSGKSSFASASPSVVPLKRLVISVDWDDCRCGSCHVLDNGSETIDKALSRMCLWPSFSVMRLHNNSWGWTLTVRASVAGAQLVDLFIQYPNDSDALADQYYYEQSRRHISILESKRPR